MESPEGTAQATSSDAGKQKHTNPRRGPPSCKQCRARKVKCDRLHPRCRACTRLQLHCSFGRHSSSPEPDTTDAADLTQAGTKRKRVRHACKACRVVKARCSGQYPCDRCASRGWPCEDLAGFGEAVNTQNVHLGQKPDVASFPDDAVSAGYTATPGTAASTVAPSLDVNLDKASIRGYIDAYFETTSRSSVAILHKPTMLADWNAARLDPVLLKAVVATGRYRAEPRDGQAMARLWMREIQSEVLSHLARNSVTQLQILVLLVRFRFVAADYAEAWNLLPLAARLAFTMRLNHEQESLRDSVAQETRRRLVWAIYQMDRSFCGGIDDLAVCPTGRMHIRLPCDEQSFQRGGQSRAGFLVDDGPQDGVGMDMYAFQLRLFLIRERVLG